MRELTKTAIDRLGDRLRSGPLSDADLELLDRYRRSFAVPYGIVVEKIRKELSLEPTGRPAKSTRSIIEKLKRETIRLSQMQDIAGCRVLVADIAEQDQVSARLGDLFPGAMVIDRREKPSYGYRAVHLIAKQSGKPIEIQVRTSLQHAWAELSEKGADLFGSALKYGGGPILVRLSYWEISRLLRGVERWGKRRADWTEEATLGKGRSKAVDRMDRVRRAFGRHGLNLLRWALLRSEREKGKR